MRDRKSERDREREKIGNERDREEVREIEIEKRGE